MLVEIGIGYRAVDMKLAGKELETLAMDHHGLVAAVCKDLGLAKKIDKRIGVDKQRVVSPGQAAVAMVLNGLGFTNRRLYLTHQFFLNKPVSRLLGANIRAEDLTDDTLGHALDEIAEYGPTKLFGEIAFGAAVENNLLGAVNHLDTTSMSVHGNYEVSGEQNVIEVRHGYSKDKRQDLKQVVLSLVVNGPSNIPLWMEPLNGNSSDKVVLHETINKINEFKKQIDVNTNFRWVADSALYSENKLLKNGNNYSWLTRVPESVKEAKELVRDGNVIWEDHGDGYKTAERISNYGGIKQRWVLVESEQAKKREGQTLEKNLKLQDESLKLELWHLNKKVFKCEEDAQQKIAKVIKKHKAYKIDAKVVPVMKYARRGKPRDGEEKKTVGYVINAKSERNREEIKKLEESSGRFVLATNNFDEAYSDKKILKEYKEQQGVESGFRFLKDPWFMVDSIFLKSPNRIAALMMIMTLCLLIYTIAQYKLRETLKSKNETLPNQVGKQVKNPTMRWIFQIMEGVSIVRFYKKKVSDPIREVLTNLNTLRQKIVSLFGNTACQMYAME